MPCGRCRQLLWEHGGADMLIETVSLGIVPMRDVLPDAFGPEDLIEGLEEPIGAATALLEMKESAIQLFI